MTQQAQAPAGEHELKATYSVDMFYINEPEPRTASPTFQHMKRTADAAGTVCAITGQPHPQYHHFFCEYAGRHMVRWDIVKGVATEQITELPVIDPLTRKPVVPAQTFPANKHFLWMLCKFAEICFGMDWHAFDPSNPESFIDSINNMLPLHERLHIGKNQGIHLKPWPEFLFEVLPLVDGFILLPDEEAVANAALGALSQGS